MLNPQVIAAFEFMIAFITFLRNENTELKLITSLRTEAMHQLEGYESAHVMSSRLLCAILPFRFVMNVLQ